jgi:hypothetical protein
MTHICECEPGLCTCGRPRGRQGNPELAHEAVRLGQLQSLYASGGTPTAEDIEFLTNVRRT